MWSMILYHLLCRNVPVVQPRRKKVVTYYVIFFLATGWTLQGSNPDRGKFFRTHPDRSWGPASLLYNGYGEFSVGKTAGAWR